MIDGFWTQPNRDPKRAYRWLVIFPNMPNGAIWYAKKVKKPKINVSKTEHQYLNHTFKYPGRVTWDDVTCTLVDPVSPDAAHHLAATIQGSGYLIPRTYNDVTTISKARANEMLGEVQIVQINESIDPNGVRLRGSSAKPMAYGQGTGAGSANIVEAWTLKNAWLMDVDFGELDYESDELTQIQLTLAYDYATLLSPEDLQGPLGEKIGQMVPPQSSGKQVFEPHGQ